MWAGGRKILVPLDGSPGSEAVLGQVTRLAEAERAGVRLLHVAAPAKARVAGGRLVDHADRHARRLAHDALAYLASVAAAVPEARVETHVRFGDPVEEILAAAEAPDVALVAMATRRRSGVRRLLHRSVAARVRRAAGVPVLLVAHAAAPGLAGREDVRSRRFFCLACRAEVEVELVERGLPGLREAVAIRRCTAFDPPTAVACARRCLDPTFRRLWAPGEPPAVRPDAA